MLKNFSKRSPSPIAEIWNKIFSWTYKLKNNKGRGGILLERTISAEGRIRRAEEIYYRRKLNNRDIRVSSANVNTGEGNEKRQISLFRKMILQILICTVIYVVFYAINNNYIFSQDVVTRTQAFLKTDINFEEVSKQVNTFFQNNQQYFGFLGSWFNNEPKQEQTNEINQENSESTNNQTEEDNNQANNEQVNSEANQTPNGNQAKNEENNNQTNNDQTTPETSQTTNEQTNKETNESTNTELNNMTTNKATNSQTNQQIGAGGAEENVVEASSNSSSNKTQMEIDAEYIKKNFKLQLPLKGTITSHYGKREPTEIISANHRGIDIGINVGTTVVASMEGTVSVVSDEGDYGTHVKIVNKDVMTVYAHCSKILVKEGDTVKKGQKIALSGNTGNSTGPHLHFEIRKDERTVDPELILDWE